MSKDLVTMTIEIDREVYNKAAELFKNLGTTIEDMTVGFLKFCVIRDPRKPACAQGIFWHRKCTCRSRCTTGFTS